MGKRNRILAAGLLGALAILILLTAPARDARNHADPRVSTFRNTANGVRALYLALDELGVPVGRWLYAFADADTLPATLAVIAPTRARPCARSPLQSCPVHAGPDADGYHRRERAR